VLHGAVKGRRATLKKGKGTERRGKTLRRGGKKVFAYLSTLRRHLEGRSPVKIKKDGCSKRNLSPLAAERKERASARRCPRINRKFALGEIIR